MQVGKEARYRRVRRKGLLDPAANEAQFTSITLDREP